MIFPDPNIKRKGKIVKDHLESTTYQGMPVFSLVEFNITELCNRTCSFCPRVDPKVYPNRNKHISTELYEKIMIELSEFSYNGNILFSAFSEPLLHKQLETLIQLSKKHCPGARVELVSNGDLVTLQKLQMIFEAGLDTILISLYDSPHQNEYFEQMRNNAGLRKDQMILRERYLSAKDHYGLTLSNRAGHVNLSEAGIKPLTQSLNTPCYYPFFQITIDFDGTVLLCPHDWGKVIRAGNLTKDKLKDVWMAKAILFARKRLIQSRRNFSPCQACNVRGTYYGKEHFNMWIKYFHEK